jgi:ElaB/YqjD/DUF883 family membrane-anchored ribosome-binding protein
MHYSSDDDAEVIREQMEETRNSLTEKLEALEHQVTETASEAAAAVTDSVQSVKDAVQETVETVKDSVHDTVETVKSTFDINYQMQQRPWMMLAGAALVGYIGGRAFERRREDAQMPPEAVAPERVLVAHKVSNGASAPPPAEPSAPSLFDKVKERYGEELAKVGGLGLAALVGLVRDNISESVNPEVGERLSEIIDDVTAKLGGKPFRGPVLPKRSRKAEAQEAMSTAPVTSERMKGRFGTGS